MRPSLTAPDRVFARAALARGIVSPETLLERLAANPVGEDVRARLAHGVAVDRR